MVKQGAITVAFWFWVPEALPIEDASSEQGKVWDHAIGVTAAQSGFPVYWGRVVENPDKVLVLVVYESLDARINARTAAWRKNAIREIMTLSTRYPDVNHIEFNDDIVPALEAPVCGIAAAYFEPGDEREPTREHFESFFRQHEAHYARGSGAKQVAGAFTGWSLEDDVPYAAWYDGSARRGKGFFMASGWGSREHLYEYQTSGMATDGSRELLDLVDGWVIQSVKFRRREVEPMPEGDVDPAT